MKEVRILRARPSDEYLLKQEGVASSNLFGSSVFRGVTLLLEPIR
jgi:hypothetical protein